MFTATRDQRKGFTLVELLVVIGIIALLIAILMPALRKAKDAANAAKCQTNLRTMMTAAIMFAQDNKDHLPGNDGDRGNVNPNYRDFLAGPPQGMPFTNFQDAPRRGTLWKYIRSTEVYRCPSMEGQFGAAYAGSNDVFDYAMFGGLSGAKASKVKGTAMFRLYPDNRVVSGLPIPVFVQEHHVFINGSNIEGNHSNDDAISTIHGGGSYYAANDGSVHYFIESKVPGARPGYELRADYDPMDLALRWSAQCPLTKNQKSLGRSGTQFGRWNDTPASDPNDPRAW